MKKSVLKIFLFNYETGLSQFHLLLLCAKSWNCHPARHRAAAALFERPAQDFASQENRYLRSSSAPLSPRNQARSRDGSSPIPWTVGKILFRATTALPVKSAKRLCLLRRARFAITALTALLPSMSTTPFPATALQPAAAVWKCSASKELTQII